VSYSIFDGSKKWPFARVPYVIDELSFPPGSPQRTSIDNAVKAWNTGSAVVRIVPRQNEPDYVQFIPDEARTASQVGRKGGRQDVVAAFFPALVGGTTVAAIDQVPDQIDCFYFDGAGALRVNWVIGNGTWNGPTALTKPGVGKAGQPIAVARQTDHQIDVFFVDGSGVVNVMWVVDGGVWQGPVGLTRPGTAVANSSIATARQSDHQIDIFFVDLNGVVNDVGDRRRHAGSGCLSRAALLRPARAWRPRADEQPDRLVLREHHWRGRREGRCARRDRLDSRALASHGFTAGDGRKRTIKSISFSPTQRRGERHVGGGRRRVARSRTDGAIAAPASQIATARQTSNQMTSLRRLEVLTTMWVGKSSHASCRVTGNMPGRRVDGHCASDGQSDRSFFVDGTGVGRHVGD
jgi:hypothetical protein